jgi:hypothetical protein
MRSGQNQKSLELLTSNNEAAHPNAPKFMHSFDQLSNPEARP